VDISDGQIILCQLCGADNTILVTNWKDQHPNLTLNDLKCHSCQGYLDGSWDCEGNGSRQHDRIRNAADIVQCLHVVPSDFIQCGNFRPGFEPPHYCVGCMRDKGHDPNVFTGLVNDVAIVSSEDFICPFGHKVKPVCPNCNSGDHLHETRLLDKGRGRERNVYVCGQPQCQNVTSGSAWASCPTCDFPLLDPGSGAPSITCPRCNATMARCSPCHDRDPFRLVAYPETSIGKPDINATPVCPAHP
jgi:hypothetical protein